MMHDGNDILISTIGERCRVCYTCVRECPAKAIRIADGQAEVIPERCIGCGNCVRVCSQHAKRVLSSTEKVYELLKSDSKVSAIIAPSFPAEFPDFPYDILIGMIRKMGFDYVNEVGFGADLVADRYRKLLESRPDKRHIATSCPAIVGYIERYNPELIDSLAPIVSPMIATARALRAIYGEDIKIVFIGPCIAKKSEAGSELVKDEVQAALTFAELRGMICDMGIKPDKAAASDFDPPHASVGAIFPISRGLLQAADINENLLTGEVVVAGGKTSFVEAVKEFHDGSLDAKLLEVLCCEGCIMGAGTTCNLPMFTRRNLVSQYVRKRQKNFDRDKWRDYMDKLAGLDLSRQYIPNDQRIPVPFENEIIQIMIRMGKLRPEDELNCGACGYETCREHAVAIFKGLAESEMCLPNTIEQLRKTINDLKESDRQLADTQEALMQSEKLASMGQLAAGIAHEVNNPLGIVLMYAHLLLEEAGENEQISSDLKMIVQQADRCKKIVSGLLHFARQNKVTAATVNVRKLAEHVLATMPGKNKIKTEIRCDTDNPVAEVDRDQITQVLTNLIENAIDAMNGEGTLTISISGDKNSVKIDVSDTGTGITHENLGKIFEPFFTTKQMGKGTGLGLAITYGIVKMHRGDISVQSNPDPAKGPTGTTFTVTLPRKVRRD